MHICKYVQYIGEYITAEAFVLHSLQEKLFAERKIMNYCGFTKKHSGDFTLNRWKIYLRAYV